MAVTTKGTRQERRRADGAPRREAALRRALAGRVDGEVRFDPGFRAAYFHDSSTTTSSQIEAGTAARPRHLAELLADLLPDEEGR